MKLDLNVPLRRDSWSISDLGGISICQFSMITAEAVSTLVLSFTSVETNAEN